MNNGSGLRGEDHNVQDEGERLAAEQGRDLNGVRVAEADDFKNAEINETSNGGFSL